MEEDSLYEERIKELYVNKGMSIGQIRDALNIEKAVVYRVISRHKLKHQTEPANKSEINDALFKLFFEPDLGKLITDTFRLTFDSIYESALHSIDAPTNDAKVIAGNLHIDQRLVEIAFKQFEKDGRMAVIDHYIKHPEVFNGEGIGGAFI